MFKLFKNSKKVNKKDLIFLSSLVKLLPIEYNFLKLNDQIDKEFLLEKELNKKDGYYDFTLNANLEKRYSNPLLSEVIILQNILVWNHSKNNFENIDLVIFQGMISGFKLGCDYDDLDFDKVNFENIQKKVFENDDKKNLLKIIGTEFLEESYLDLNDTFEIKVIEGVFYTIKKLEDGNYLAVNKKGNVYKLQHDPYKIENQFDSIQLLLLNVNSHSPNRK